MSRYRHEDASVRATCEWAHYEQISASIRASYTPEKIFMSAAQRAELDAAWNAVKATKEWAAAPGEA